MPSFSDDGRSILFQDHFLVTQVLVSHLPGVSDPGDALRDLFHLDLNDLVLEVHAFLVNLLLQDRDCLGLLVGHDLLFQLIQVELNLAMCLCINLLQGRQLVVN